MRKYFVISFLLLSLFSRSQTQQIDSLKKILPFIHASERVDCLNELSEAYTYLQTDTAKMYAVKSYIEALKINYLRGMAKSFSNRGYIEGKALGHFPLAEIYARNAIELYKKTNDEKGLADAYIIWSFALFVQGFYDSSVKGCIKTIQLCQKIDYNANHARALTLIGINYLESGRYAKAFEYSMEGLKVAKQSRDSDRIATSLAIAGNLYSYAGDPKMALTYYFESLSYANGEELLWHPLIDLGDIHYLQKQYDSALYYYKRCIDTIKSITTDPAVRYGFTMNPLTGIGETILAKKEYNNALVYFKEILNHHEKANDQQQVMRLLLDIARAHYGKKDYAAALHNARRCLLIAEKFSAKQYIRDGNQLMSAIYEKSKRIDSAYFYYSRYVNIKDSVALEAFNRKIALYNAAAELGKGQTQIELLSNEKLINQQQLKIQQQQLANGTLQKEILIAGIIGLSLISAIIFRAILLKRKNEKNQREIAENQLQIQKVEVERTKAELQQQATELEMQALRAQMNPHFIFNSLNCINMFILENNKLQASEYLSKFSRLVRLILQNSQEAFIPLEKELEALRLYLQLESLRFKNKFEHTISVDENVDTAMLKVPPLVIQPFAENAIWHGLMHKKENRKLEIEAYVHEEILYCKITDDGIGRKWAAELKSRSALTHKSMGMSITANRIAALQQQNEKENFISITDLVLSDGSPGGTEVLIKIPVSYD